MSKEERNKEIDKMIDRMDKWRKSREQAGAQGGNRGGQGGGHRRGGNTERRMSMFLEEADSDTRAKLSEMMKQFRARREERKK
jgi:hypothetical protein